MEASVKAKTSGKLKIEEKAKILAWKADGASSEKIAARLGHHHLSIDRLFVKSIGLPDNAIPGRKKCSGRPRKMTEDLLAILKRQIDKYPMMTTADLKESTPELAGVAHHTIAHVLQKYLKVPS
jgi:hypothetical protein